MLPRTLLRTASLFNPDIRVTQEWGGNKLLVNGSRQSGSYIRMLWEKTFRKFRTGELTDIKSILVLGVGGGTAIELLVKRFPGASITSVDIDPTIIDIAKKYFRIDKLPNIQLVCADAKNFVEKCEKKGKKFDLVIVDLFIGREIPGFVSSDRFLQRLARINRPGGSVIINFLRENEYQSKSDDLFSRLKGVFSKIEDFEIANNRFFFART